MTTTANAGGMGMQLAAAKVLPMATLGPQRFSDEQKALILKTCCGGAAAHEAQVLVAIAEARGLNPITGECYFVKRYDKDRGVVWAVQASIDSFRIKAEETGDYAGQDEPTFEYNDKNEVVAAKVAVYRKSVPGRPFAVGVARWDEYVQTTKDGRPTRFWSQMPHNQLAKCAEALALRKAFPKVLAKIYTPEEMAQAGNGSEKEPAAMPAPASAPQLPEAKPEATDAKPKEVVATPTFKRYAALIRSSASGGELGAVAAEIKKAVDSGELSPKQREKLTGIFAEHKTKLENAEAANVRALEVDSDVSDAAEVEAEVMAGAHDE